MWIGTRFEDVNKSWTTTKTRLLFVLIMLLKHYLKYLKHFWGTLKWKFLEGDKVRRNFEIKIIAQMGTQKRVPTKVPKMVLKKVTISRLKIIARKRKWLLTWASGSWHFSNKRVKKELSIEANYSLWFLNDLRSVWL